MSIVYAMSDIHGCLAEFEEALFLAEEHLEEDDVRLVLLGIIFMAENGRFCHMMRKIKKNFEILLEKYRPAFGVIFSNSLIIPSETSNIVAGMGRFYGEHHET